MGQPDANEASEAASDAASEAAVEAEDRHASEQVLEPLSEAGPEAAMVIQHLVESTMEAMSASGGGAKLEEEFIRVAKLEDLRPEDRNLYHSCTRAGVCARCKWMTGCDSCDEEKAWGFACRSTLWHTADAALRPMRKPRGRPKSRAS